MNELEMSILRQGQLNVANPVEFAAQEYLCAMKVLDDWGVPREAGDKTFSLVGRIDWLKENK
jgi:hypothetical protein